MVTLWPQGVYASEHFKVADFNCHDEHATPYPVEWIEARLVPFCRNILEPIRHLVCGDKFMLVTSGYRTPEWNKHEGGAPGSRHIHGDAADVWCPPMGMTAGPALYLAVLSLHRAGLLPELGGLGLYSNRIHVDARPGELVTWNNLDTLARG